MNTASIVSKVWSFTLVPTLRVGMHTELNNGQKPI